jgi:hypothetical protein
MHVPAGGTDFLDVAAGAGDRGHVVVRMNVFFHGQNSLIKLKDSRIYTAGAPNASENAQSRVFAFLSRFRAFFAPVP